ncbi:bis(5'-nucleosyl)-tetraphosphatase (symmetrical) YqeK [Ruminococcus sp.]|uniref:bis(5'-nucleosyl)-tetraphosphatase (symmetrical) YqeK n=1 Tax=Ruminococcus sp. TaxID=41978 RepID=UPI0025E25EA1|nr:bis(5'-nucleosyl)-tetraphosphatase (symmetrical) YqeK [Ruminococcus sp.]MBQ8965137.1 bis(5'-nucleosyl)-tetraphosphatase (symmetrical) YqeK [Ruminococcus sp.]
MKESKQIGIYKKYLREHLSKKRYTHSLNVAASAVALAKKYEADSDKAYTAGLLHDIAKELPAEEQLALVKNSGLMVSEVETKSLPLYHAIAGAELVQQLFDIRDEEMIWAIRWHTVAAGDMSRLAEVIYLADLISADRDYKDVGRMRKLADKSLERAMCEALRFSIGDSVGKGNSIPLSTLEAYNRYIVYKK